MRLTVLAPLLVSCAVATAPDRDDRSATHDSDTPEAPPSAADSAGPDDSDARDTGIARDSDRPAPLGGTLTTIAGAPLGPTEVLVRYCRPTGCLVTDQAIGTWGLEDLPLGIGSVEAVDVTGGPRFATFAVPYVLRPGGRTTLAVRVPELSPPLALPATPSTLELTAGVRMLAVRKGSLVSRDGSGTQAEEVGAAVIAPGDLPVIEGVDGEVLGAFLLHPFDHAVQAGARLEVANAWTLKPREAQLWVSIYDEARWQLVGDLAYGAGIWLKTDSPLPRTGTLLVVRPPPPAP